ncbi:site-specific integrase [Pedobacter sp. HDW13]|uniref:tyrosine-type recombinase/integrase n=1 Tax=Pedobacter sp. HDW13 TaxID=2714940 RepID=UPI00140DC516|nr:site-specific integrase [Pedobacter sp. HDW13]QIL42394.1 site-specific integrase [Pedobacter sp. HDW13]
MGTVTLRRKTLNTGRQSLYLDYYPPLPCSKSGKVLRFVTLKLYLYTKPENELQKIHNKETLLTAQTVCAQRQIELQNRRFGIISEHERNASFTELFRQVAKSRRKSLNDHWEMGLRYFIAFSGPDLRLPELSDFLCEDYKYYLLSGPGIARYGRPIKRNTAVTYYAKFRAVLRIAYRRKLIPLDLHAIVDPIPPKETNRERLTLEEFQHLADTPAGSELMKNAAIFSGLTGLRWSDVSTLSWSELRGKKGSYEIQFSQGKTDKAEVMPISDQAVERLGKRQGAEELLFPGLKYYQLKSFFTGWLAAADINKNITFHSFRHTFATLQLELGTDIYTVSKLLGIGH